MICAYNNINYVLLKSRREHIPLFIFKLPKKYIHTFLICLLKQEADKQFKIMFQPIVSYILCKDCFLYVVIFQTQREKAEKSCQFLNCRKDLQEFPLHFPLKMTFETTDKGKRRLNSPNSFHILWRLIPLALTTMSS